MNALILAAGFGTRLKPWTDHHPKALVEVAGRPMLERVLERLDNEGFDRKVVNVHHFSEQIKDFIKSGYSDTDIRISDESDKILDTGGGLLKASELFEDKNTPILVHNVDILSDAPLNKIFRLHLDSGRDISLLTSDRDSSRKLIFDESGCLRGWHDVRNGIFKPGDFHPEPNMHSSSFSGIYIVGPSAIEQLRCYKNSNGNDIFPIMDFFLWVRDKIKIGEIKSNRLNLIDIGKPDTLKQADMFLKTYL